MAVFVVVPRYVRRSDAKYARKTADERGVSYRIVAAPIPGQVMIDFEFAVECDEDPVPEAFEIEVDNLLRRSTAPFARGAFRFVKFSGTGARVEDR